MCVLGPIECLPAEELRYNFEVNLFGLINTTNAFLPLLRKGDKFPFAPDLPQDIFQTEIFKLCSLFFEHSYILQQ
jgi:NAD(P)-dependent dehydrogenase (short-subunit alcohol dehydrogenase family)